MAEREWDPTAMDNAATDAENELSEISGQMFQPMDGEGVITVVADWWKKWYGKAGHKRLGRILLQYSTTSNGNNNSKIILNKETGKFEQTVGE